MKVAIIIAVTLFIVLFVVIAIVDAKIIKKRKKAGEQTNYALQIARNQTNCMLNAKQRVSWLNQYFFWYYDQGGKNSDSTNQISQYMQEYFALANGFDSAMNKWKKALSDTRYELSNLVIAQNKAGGVNIMAYSVYDNERDYNELLRVYENYDKPIFEERFLQIARSYSS